MQKWTCRGVLPNPFGGERRTVAFLPALSGDALASQAGC